MTEPTPEPEQPAPAAPASSARKSNHVRNVVMALVMLGAIGFLVFVKQGSDGEKAEAIKAALAAKRELAERNEKIADTVMDTYHGKSSNSQQLALVARVGKAIVEKSDAKSPATTLKFHLLAETDSINMFALASGDVFVTTALINRMKTEGQLAAALAHGAAHVIAGDVPEALEKSPTPLPLWAYRVESERAADTLAVKLMSQAGYDPNAMVGMFTIFADGYRAGADVAFFTSHPNEEKRLDNIAAAIVALYPEGIPAVLSK